MPPVQSRLRPEAEPYINRPITPFQTQNIVSDRSEVTMEGNSAQRSVTMETYEEREQQQEVALRTVPIILKNGSRRVLVNCLLDEGIDTTYVNEGVVEELGLGGKKQQITVRLQSDNRRPVSSVGRVPDYRAGGRGFKHRPDQHSGSLNN